jgi:hypothetical protein
VNKLIDASTAQQTFVGCVHDALRIDFQYVSKVNRWAGMERHWLSNLKGQLIGQLDLFDLIL